MSASSMKMGLPVELTVSIWQTLPHLIIDFSIVICCRAGYVTDWNVSPPSWHGRQKTARRAILLAWRSTASTGKVTPALSPPSVADGLTALSSVAFGQRKIRLDGTQVGANSTTPVRCAAGSTI